jgi:alkylation response protein AidB-like acyl-CoA dehydrogenase
MDIWKTIRWPECGEMRLGQIGGGTSEIHCEIISKAIIDGRGYKAPIVNPKEPVTAKK